MCFQLPLQRVALNMKIHARSSSWIMISSGTIKAGILLANKHASQTRQGIDSKDASAAIMAHPYIMCGNAGSGI